MTALSASPNPSMSSPAHPDSGWRKHLPQVGLWLLLWLSMLKLPDPPSSGLDPSWRMVMGYALGHGFQWGTDLVFTYGPLGYLLAATNHGANYSDYLIWQALSNAVFTTAIVVLGRHLSGWRRVLFFAYFVVLVANYLDAMHIIMVVLLVLSWLRENVQARRWLVVGVGVMLAILSLVKFTNLMLAGFGVGCVAALHLWRRRWSDLAFSAGSFVVAFLAGWLLCRQHLGNLPAYLLTSLNASSGYGEGMSYYEQPATLILGLLCNVTLIAYYAISLFGRRDFPRALVATAVVAANSFLNWKHGYTRADGHVFAHYVATLLVPVTFPFLTQDDGPFPRLKRTFLVAAFAAGVYSILATFPGALVDAGSIWNYNIKKVATALWQLPTLKADARRQFDDTAKPHILPAVRRVVGDDTIDMLGNEQAYMIFNRFNYVPRPVFQTYLPYTVELARINEDFFRSDRAPKYVLQKMDTIDYRLPALEDALSARYLYYHYDYVLEEKGMLLWRRAKPNPELDRQTLIAERTAQFGEIIPVPNQGDTGIWAEMDIQPSLLGSVRSFLYKAPHLTISVSEGGSFRNSYHLIRRTAQTGFLAYPHFSSAGNIQRYMAGEAPPRAESLSVELPEAQRKYFKAGFKVRFYALAPLPRSAGLVAGTTEDKFRMFDRVPDAATALYPVTILNVSDREVLFAHPPSSIEFKVNFPATRVTGLYGFADNAYAPPNATDGAEFNLVWIGPDGQTTKLMSRLLQPVTVPKDRGPQAFDVALPQGGGRLFLQINAGPQENLAFDWTYWTDVRFKP